MTYACSDARRPCNYVNNTEAGLEGEMVNEWRSKKVTLQNMIAFTYTEGPAYDVIRSLGLIAPMSEYITVQLWRGNKKPVPEHEYMLLETINDKKFVEKHIGENAMLFEVEEQKLQYKRGTGVYDSNEVENYATENLLGFFFENPLAYTPNMEAFKRFHGTEAAIWSWDSMCMIGNNGYLVRLS